MPKANYAGFAKRLAQLTDEVGELPVQIAADIDCTKASYYGWLRGERFPSVEYLLALCLYFGVDPNDLLDWDSYIAKEEAAK